MCGYVYDLARRLAEEHGHDVRVVAPWSPGVARDHELLPVRVERFRHPWPGARRLDGASDAGASVRSSTLARLEAIPFATALAARAARGRRWADVVCSHWLVPAGAAAALVGARPHVAVAHGGDVHLLERMPAGAPLARAIAARTDRIVCVSRDLAARVAALAPAARTEVVAMGAEIGPAPAPEEAARFRAELGVGQPPAGRPVALFLGRLVPIKGADLLVEAAARAGVDVWIAGEGPELDRLRERARADTLRVSFLGCIDRRRRRLALEACDVVVAPSRIESDGREEGTPVACAEALAAGRPVVASETGGIRELIEDGRTGLLVPPGDAGALAAALARFAGDGELRGRLRAGARDAGPSVTMRATAARIDGIFREVREGSH